MRHFSLGKYKELHEARFNDISVEALLFDAYKGVSLSIVEIIDYYLTFENHLQEKAEKLRAQSTRNLNKSHELKAQISISPDNANELKTQSANSLELACKLKAQAVRVQENADRQQKQIYNPIKKFIFNRLKLLVNNEIQPNELLNPSGGKQMKRFHPPMNRGSFIQGVQDIKCFTKDTNKEALINTNKVFNEDIEFKLFEYDQTLYNKRNTKLKKVEILLKRFYLTEESYIDKRHMEEQQYIIHDKLTKLYEDKSKPPQR